MSNLEKIITTIDALRNQVLELRGRDNFEGLNIRIVEFLLLQAYVDMTELFRMLEVVAAERDQLKVQTQDSLTADKAPEGS